LGCLPSHIVNVNQPCIFCGAISDLTRDHVPPKCFFPKPRPSNLVTVPSCLRCNNRSGLDEEHFLATLMFSGPGISPAGKLLWSEKLSRMYDKNLGLRKRIAHAIRYADIFSEGGIYLGRGMRIQVDEARTTRVLHKILRGLFYFEYGAVLSSNAVITALWLRTPDHYAMAWRHRDQLRAGRLGWPSVFQYSCNRVATQPNGSAWLMVLFDAVSIFAVTRESKIVLAAA